LSERWLRDRTFELVVAPAIADWQFDEGATGLRRARNSAAVIAAFAWGLYEDAISDPGGLGTFALLAAIPACYYTMLVAVCAPIAGRADSLPLSSSGVRIAVGLTLFALSLGPVLACYWPDRPARRVPTDTP
jgi:hypothetical protein